MEIALVDSTVFIDAFKVAALRRVFEDLRQRFGFTVTTDIVQLEFKAVLIQQMVTVHAKLYECESFTKARFYLTESQHPQKSLRIHIFNEFLTSIGPAKSGINEETDRKYAERARLLLEMHIPRVHKAFTKMIDDVMRQIRCDRAIEPPIKKGTRSTFGSVIPTCIRGRNKSCYVEQVVKDSLIPHLSTLRAIGSEQIDTACDRCEQVRVGLDMDSKDCRCIGDALIVLGGDRERITHTISTNERDWGPLSKLIDAVLVVPANPIKGRETREV